MTTMLPPVLPTVRQFTPLQTVIELGSHSIAVRRRSEGKLIAWLEANGIDPTPVLVDQTIHAVNGRIHLQAVDTDERGAYRFEGSDIATKHIDVPLVKLPHEFGL